MSDLPTTDDILGVPPTADDILGPKQEYWTMDGQHFDEEFMQGGAGKILDYFGAGWKQGWGTRPLGDNEKPEESWVKQMRDLGVFNDYDKHRNSWVKQFNESLLRGTAGALDAAMRVPMAGYYAVTKPLVETGALPRDIAAIPEAFPGGHVTAFPSRVRPTMRALEEARNLEIIGKENDLLARKAFEPRGEETPTEQVVRPIEEAAPPDTTPTAADPGDVHQVARMIAPDTFKKYDALAEQKQALTDWIEEQRQLRDAPAQARVDEILGKVNGVEARLTNRAATRLELARRELEELQAVDTPAMAVARKSRQELDFQMRDLAPEVSEAYREAYRQIPREEPALDAVREPIEPAVSGEVVPFEPRVEPTAVAPAQIVELAQRRPTIARDVERQLVAAGRDAEEARASAALIQAHYEARAARFNGALGRARDLYEADDPTITGVASASRRGSLNLARNEIRLFQNADASTFIHETGHQWLEEIRRDAAHELAPEDLKADLETVKAWLGTEGDTFTRAQHEKFARGFERYLMEGQAPTSRLAAVFEKFKNWLTQIYQSVARLRAPITDDIRGVYDRLLSAPSKEPVIAPERPGAVDFATHAETVAHELTTPRRAGGERQTAILEELDARNAPDIAYRDAFSTGSKRPLKRGETWRDRLIAWRDREVKRVEESVQNLNDAANNIQVERERVAQILSKAVDDARREARRGPQRVQLPEREGAGGEPTSARESPTSPDDAIDTGRNPPTGKSTAPRSASKPFDPVDGALVDKAGNIRVDNLNVPEDVGAAIKQAAAEGDGFTEARRGVLTDAETLKLADDLGMSANRLDRRRIGEAFNAEEIVQARRLLVHAATNVRDTMAQAATGSAEGIIQYAIARERLLMIQEQVAGITAEAGRALRAFRAIEGVKDASNLADFFQKNIGKTPEALQREALMGLRLDASINVNKFVRMNAAPGWQHMVTEAWMSSLLSGPFTHVRNVVGNATVAFNSVVETGVAAGVSRALRHEHGVEFAEVGDRIWGMGKGSVDGITAFGKAIMDETYALERAAKTDERAFRRAIPDVEWMGYKIPLGQIIRFPLRLLAGADELFKAFANQQQLNVLARRSARLEGLEGSALQTRIAELLQDPTDEMIVGAVKHAEYQTFTNPLGKSGRAVQLWADAHPLTRFIVPFVRTPINIMKYGAERTPFGLASAAIRDNLLGKNGEVAQATQIARMGLGTAVMTGVAVLAYSGLISGGGPTQAGQVNTERQTGELPYAFRIGDTWVSYRGLDPLSFVVGLAADMAEIAKYSHHEDADFQKLTAMAVANIAGHDFNDKLPFRTISTAFAALADWQQYGPRLINQMAGTLVPGIVGQTAQISDPVMRETRSLADAMRARIGLRGDLQPRRDVWGEPIPQSDIGPVQVSEAINDPVRLEVARLGMGMGRAQRKLENVELTPQQYDDYVRISGRFAKAQLDDMVDQAWYKSQPDGVKRHIIHDVITSARQLAKGQVLMESVGTENDLIEKAKQEKLKILK